jgi:hypothetical protein
MDHLKARRSCGHIFDGFSGSLNVKFTSSQLPSLTKVKVFFFFFFFCLHFQFFPKYSVRATPEQFVKTIHTTFHVKIPIGTIHATPFSKMQFPNSSLQKFYLLHLLCTELEITANLGFLQITFIGYIEIVTARPKNPKKDRRAAPPRPSKPARP